MTEHSYPTFARDTDLSYAARGVLSVLTLPEYDQTGATLNELLYPGTDRVETLRLLAELSGNGYVHKTEFLDKEVWIATGRAYRLTTVGDACCSRCS